MVVVTLQQGEEPWQGKAKRECTRETNIVPARACLQYLHPQTSGRDLRQSNDEGLVSRVIDFVHKQLHSVHLAPRCVRRRSVSQPFVQFFLAAQGLVLLHHLHQSSHAIQGFILALQCNREFGCVNHVWLRLRQLIQSALQLVAASSLS